MLQKTIYKMMQPGANFGDKKLFVHFPLQYIQTHGFARDISSNPKKCKLGHPSEYGIMGGQYAITTIFTSHDSIFTSHESILTSCDSIFASHDSIFASHDSIFTLGHSIYYKILYCTAGALRRILQNILLVDFWTEEGRHFRRGAFFC